MARLDEIKNRAMLEVAGAPISLIPFLAGVSGYFFMFATKDFSFMGLTAATTAVAWGVTSSAYRFFYSQAVMDKVVTAIKEEQKASRNKEISTLRYTLKGQSVQILEDIVGLQDLLQTQNTDGSTASDVIISANQLLEQSLLNLKKIPSLDTLYNNTSSMKAKQIIQDKRSEILKETKENVNFVATVVTDVQGLDSNTDTSQESMRAQLSDRLEVAKAVDQRLMSLGLNGFKTNAVPVSR